MIIDLNFLNLERKAILYATLKRQQWKTKRGKRWKTWCIENRGPTCKAAETGTRSHVTTTRMFSSKCSVAACTLVRPLRLGTPRLSPWLCFFRAGTPGARYWTSLCLNVLICQMWILLTPASHVLSEDMKSFVYNNLARREPSINISSDGRKALQKICATHFLLSRSTAQSPIREELKVEEKNHC